MKHLTFFVLGIQLLCNLLAANNSEQQLKGNDSLKIEGLCDSCFLYMYSDKSKAKYYCQLMLQACEKTKNEYSKADAYKIAGTYYTEIPDYVNAFTYYKKSVDIASKINNRSGKILYAKVILSFGLLYHHNGDFETALNMYLESDSILTRYHEINSLINLYSKLSDLYDRLHQPDKSYIYYKKIIKLAEQTNDPLSIASAYISYANSIVDSGKYQQAEEYLLKALKLSEKNKRIIGITTAYYNLGYLESQRKNYKKALFYMEKVLELAHKTGNQYDECDALNKLGRNKFFLGEFKSAQHFLEQGIIIARKSGYNELLRKHLDVLVSVEGGLGNYQKALNLREEYTSLYLETVDVQVQKQVNFLDAKYQNQKRENHIKELEDEKRIKDLQIVQRQQWIYGLSSIIALLLILSISAHYNYRHKKQIAQQESTLKEQRIYQLQKEQQLLATQSVLQGEERERGRLARDLHDGLGGLLSGVKLTLSNMRGNFILSEQSVGLFDKALVMLDSSIHELRKVAHNMMPEALVKFGLKEALTDYCNSFEHNQTKIQFQYFGSEKRFESKIEIGLYRIAQELVNNAIKYSEGSEIIIQLILEESRVNLTVQDNGKGFDALILKSSKGAGMANVRSRIESLNGKLDINSEPGKGTEVFVEFYF